MTTKEPILKLQAVTIGNAVVDTHIVSTTFNKHNLHLDIKHPVQSMSASVGGGAINAAATLKKLNFTSAPVCAIGSDHAAQLIAEQLEQKEIEIEWLAKKNTHSHQSTVVSVPGQPEPLIFSYKNPLLVLEAQEVPTELIATSSLLYIAAFEAQDLSAVSRALSAAGSQCTIAFNPCLSIIEHKITQLEHFLEQADIVFMNQYEAERYMEKKNKPWSLHAFFNLINFGHQKTVALTLGKNGVHVFHENQIYSHPSLANSPVNTVGAGDAFNSCLSGLLVQGHDIKTALLYGLYNSGSVTRQQSANAGILSLEELKTHSVSLNQISVSPMKHTFVF
jgi:ribokinase